MSGNTPIDRDVAALGERMVRVETKVDDLSERFASHEVAGAERYREVMGSLHEIRVALAKEDARELALMQRPGLGGMTVSETVRTGGIALALLTAIVSGFQSGDFDAEEVARIASMLEQTKTEEVRSDEGSTP